jgi:threonine/homoserine/homoserine lactone efflux protein
MILDPSLTTAYLIVATALAASPGPDFMFVLANGMRHQAKGAVAASLGIAAGSVAHALAAAIGISAAIAASPMAFDLLRYGGAFYLAFLGVQALHSFFNAAEVAPSELQNGNASAWNLFQRGLIINILNPKVIVFYLALLPQFVNISIGHVGLQVFLLGCIHNAIGLTFLLGIGLAAGRASNWLTRTGFGRWLNGIAGLFFIGLAIRLAVSEKP